MKTQITNEIIKWIGEDMDLKVSENMDTYRGYNTAIGHFRNKVPELTDTIINMIVEEVEKLDIYDFQNPNYIRDLIVERLLKD
jgi:hypothetical protein